MNDTVKHSDDEAIVSLTYTWGMVGGFLLEHGRPATDRNIEALVAACGFATASRTAWTACSTAHTTRLRDNCMTRCRRICPTSMVRPSER